MTKLFKKLQFIIMINGTTNNLKYEKKLADNSSALSANFFSNLSWDNNKKFNLLQTPSLFNILENLKIYPEAKDFLKQQLLNCKNNLLILDSIKKENYDVIYRKAKNEEFWKDLIDEFDDIERNFNNLIIKRNSFIFIKKSFQNNISIEKAKLFPITELIEIKRRFTKCLWHDENNASLYYYPKTNSCFCFSCQKYADSIEIYQKLNNCSFLEAIKALQ